MHVLDLHISVIENAAYGEVRRDLLVDASPVCTRCLGNVIWLFPVNAVIILLISIHNPRHNFTSFISRVLYVALAN